MAVQKSKVSRRRRGNRRSHDALKPEALSQNRCSTTGALTRRHHMTEDGFYRGEPTRFYAKRQKSASESGDEA